MPFLPLSAYQFCEMLTFGVTVGVTVTFKHAAVWASRPPHGEGEYDTMAHLTGP